MPPATVSSSSGSSSTAITGDVAGAWTVTTCNPALGGRSWQGPNGRILMTSSRISLLRADWLLCRTLHGVNQKLRQENCPGATPTTEEQNHDSSCRGCDPSCQLLFIPLSFLLHINFYLLFYITNKYVRALQQSLYSVYVEIKTTLAEVVTPPANSFL
jgi:hypothetical protein